MGGSSWRKDLGDRRLGVVRTRGDVDDTVDDRDDRDDGGMVSWGPRSGVEGRRAEVLGAWESWGRRHLRRLG